ncbi:family 43 glycosylhydrolase [Microbacterium halophytorum]|uniref:family 43 glycosylhydrolase n=1 Tax=Microbacterium halophytorum TaxID=2067568 RepID=UPI000CFD16DC|nr:family 43 glycosylhydrolase [Microbacterium halophytorum]
MPRPRPRAARRSLAAALCAAALALTTAPAAGATGEETVTRTIPSAGNPIIADGSYYLADAAPLVVDDTLYIYGGHDEAAEQQAGFEMHEYGVLATSDVDDGPWELTEGAMRPGDVFEWATGAAAYAGHTVRAADGRFYWYAPVESSDDSLPNRMAIGVAVADSPTGPWTDAIGAPLVDWRDVFGSSTNGQEVIDPHVLIDHDGSAHLYWGSWGVARMAPLDASMTALSGDIITLEGLDDFYEAPWVFHRGDTYYMLYDWKRGGSDCTPSNYQACVAYATASSPAGPWEFQDIILGGTSSTTVHPSMIEFDGAWYLTYHTKDSAGGGHFRRSVAVDAVTWRGDEILPVRQTWAEDPAFRLNRNIAPVAKASASFTESPPMRLGALNDGRAETALLPPDQWGNYRGTDSEVETDWVMYQWDAPVRLDGTGIEFEQDQNWIRPPASWHVEYVDEAGTWHPVEGAEYPTSANTWHEVPFEAVTTTALRAVFHGAQEGAAFHSVSVSEWEAYSVAADDLAGPTVTTTVGTAPELPEAVRLPFDGTGALWTPVNWHEVPEEDYAEPGSIRAMGVAPGQAAGEITAEILVADEPAPPGPDDGTPPDAALVPSGTGGTSASQGWYSSPVDVRVTGADETDYLLDLAGSVAGSRSEAQAARALDLRVDSEGETLVTGTAADSSGNVSEPRELAVRIDTSPPALSTQFRPDERVVAADASDGLSGLDRLEFRVDDGAWEPVAESGAIVVEDALPHRVVVRARDVAGNSTIESVTVPPTDGAALTGNLAPYATASASFTSSWESVNGLNDGAGELFDPTADTGSNWGTWSSVGEQWAQLTWDFSVTTDEIGIWWYRDTPDQGGSGMIPPRSWSLQALDDDGETWREIATDADSDAPRASSDYARVAFPPVVTTSLRIVAQAWGGSDGGGSTGIREWQVAGAGEAHDLSAEATTRCAAGTVVLVTRVANGGDAPVDATVETTHGTRTLPVDAGGTASTAITTRQVAIAAGNAVVTAGTESTTAPYPTTDCS